MKKIKVTTPNYSNIIPNKVYDIIDYIYDALNQRDLDRIVIINEVGVRKSFYVFNKGKFFEDVTNEYRTEIIDEILR